jgi:hypothetical protein
MMPDASVLTSPARDLDCRNSTQNEDGMATSKELHAWAYTLKGWAASVDNTKVREQMVQLRVELEHLAQCKEAAERQLV